MQVENFKIEMYNTLEAKTHLMRYDNATNYIFIITLKYLMGWCEEVLLQILIIKPAAAFDQ